MNRREKLISSVIGPEMDDTKARMLDATLKLILGDMGKHYYKFWQSEGPGVMVFQPQTNSKSMFFLTLQELSNAQEECEKANNDDLAETFRRIIQVVDKIDPDEKAGYIINDSDGIRFFEINYNKVTEN